MSLIAYIRNLMSWQGFAPAGIASDHRVVADAYKTPSLANKQGETT